MKFYVQSERDAHHAVYAEGFAAGVAAARKLVAERLGSVETTHRESMLNEEMGLRVLYGKLRKLARVAKKAKP